MEAECAALVVQDPAFLIAFIPYFGSPHEAANSATGHAITAQRLHWDHYRLCVTCQPTLLPVQAANRHDAAELAAKQGELAALQAEAARLSSSSLAQAEHEARFRTAAER